MEMHILCVDHVANVIVSFYNYIDISYDSF